MIESDLVIQNKSFIDASPDAVVSFSCCREGVLEIKCPYSIANQIPCERNLTYLRKTANGCYWEKMV